MPDLTQQDRLTSSWFLYNLAGDPTGYKVAKYLIHEGFVPQIVTPPLRLKTFTVRWRLTRRNSTKVPLTPSSYSGTLGRRRRGRKTSHTRTQEQAATE